MGRADVRRAGAGVVALQHSVRHDLRHRSGRASRSSRRARRGGGRARGADERAVEPRPVAQRFRRHPRTRAAADRRGDHGARRGRQSARSAGDQPVPVGHALCDRCRSPCRATAALFRWQEADGSREAVEHRLDHAGPRSDAGAVRRLRARGTAAGRIPCRLPAGRPPRAPVLAGRFGGVSGKRTRCQAGEPARDHRRLLGQATRGIPCRLRAAWTDRGGARRGLAAARRRGRELRHSAADRSRACASAASPTSWCTSSVSRSSTATTAAHRSIPIPTACPPMPKCRSPSSRSRGICTSCKRRSAVPDGAERRKSAVAQPRRRRATKRTSSPSACAAPSVRRSANTA